MFEFGTFDNLTFDQGVAVMTPPPPVVTTVSQLALMGVGCWMFAVLALDVVARSIEP